MENAQVLLIEDDEAFTKLVSICLTGTGHEITHAANNRESALAAVEAMRAGRLSVDAVLLDGNLSEGDGSGSDARAVRRALDAEPPVNVKVIGFSSLPMDMYGIAVDEDTVKDPTLIPEILDRI